ncbi:MAG: GtrA family protein [Ramlibacter sp.]|nr:GtrA family protein [Ramlibacter sp.]
MPGSSRFLRFAMVGVVGFAVDAGVLQALVSLAGWGPIGARAVAIPVAVLATWLLNRTITFAQAQAGPVLASLVRYAAVSAVGASVNFIVYSVLVFASQAMAAMPIVPLGIASIVALVVNYLGSKHFAFR